MAKCGWIDFNESQLISHTFRFGETEQGVLIPNPRMLVCPKTELYQYDVQVSEQQQKRAIVGLYDAALKDDKNIRTERVYLVFFLDENNNPLHSLPLKYAARGVNGATFEVERRAFKAQLETCHALTNQVPAKPKNDLFHALGVFCFNTSAELVGEKQNKSWCCRVVGHEAPTTENWKDYFVGYTQIKDYAWSALEPGQKIDVLSIPALEGEARGVAALLPSDESNSYELSYHGEAKSHAGLLIEPTGIASYNSSSSRRPMTLEDEAFEEGDVGF